MFRDFLRYFVGVIVRPSRTLGEMAADRHILRYGLIVYPDQNLETPRTKSSHGANKLVQ